MADPATAPRLSIIITTLGARPVDMQRLLHSIVAEQVDGIEIIVVDQSPHRAAHRVAQAALAGSAIPLVCITSERGLNIGRNAGLEVARGTFTTFTDDDAWYPQGGLTAPLQHLEHALLLDGITFVARGADGQMSSGTFGRRAGPIRRRSALIQSLEVAMMLRTDAVRGIGGFDPRMGLGTASPWGAGEGADLVLRLLADGAVMRFEPTYFVHHEDSLGSGPDAYAKLRAYSRGEGFVVARNRVTLPYAYRRIVRPFIGMSVATVRGQHELRRLRSARLTGFVRGAFDGIRRRT